MSTSTGTLDSSIAYFPFGATRTGSVNTVKEFTGQRLDQTGLYYYNARYYDPLIGRFISPDSATPDLMNPQSFNKYTYCFNNPLKYRDPNGHQPVSTLNAIYNFYASGAMSQTCVSTETFIANLGNIWTAFHEIAQVNAAKALSDAGVVGISLEHKVGNRCEADIVGNNNQVWEVKLAGTSSNAQLTKYCSMGGLERGDNMAIDPITNIPIIGDIKMRVNFGQPGEINYSFYRTGGNGEPVTVTSTEVYKQVKWRALAASAVLVSVAAATVIEDIYTGGAGIGDDIPSLMGGLKIASAFLY
jgi:RHS repeat-associated protein